MSTPITSGSPKLGCSSPGRRHNPYAATHVDGTPVSLGTPLQPSLSTSFATQPTTPQLHSAGASWTPAAAMSAVPFVPAHPPMPVGEFPLQGGPQVQSFYSDVSSPNTYHAAVPPAVYDAVDPNIAFMMYNAASAAANAAANGFVPSYMPEQYEVPLAVRHAPMPVQQRRPTQAPAMTAEPAAVPTLEDMQALQGTLVEEARTASGSSFIQSAVKETQDFRLVTYVWSQLAASLGDLLLDAHGCYVIKTLLERLPPQQIAFVLDNIQNDEQLGFSICTHSLHTRRVVQHIIENIDGGFLCALMSRHCVDVAMTQQGCIVMQRAMDHAPPGPARDRLFEAIATNLVAFAKDPYANYVVQHLMEVGERSETANNMWKAIQGRVVELACNKFASNVIEKCLFHCMAEIQHEILLEMYSVGPQMLYNMLQDSFGNYIIQSSIALATFRDVSLIDERLRPVLAHTPYGHKIEGRLDRRLKGKAVTARTPVPAAAAAAPQQQQQQQQPRRQNGRGSKAPVPAGEVPW